MLYRIYVVSCQKNLLKLNAFKFHVKYTIPNHQKYVQTCVMLTLRDEFMLKKFISKPDMLNFYIEICKSKP